MNRHLKICAAGLLAAAVTGLQPAHAADGGSAYPATQVRIVVPFLPGGGNDFLARDMGQVLQQAYGQSFVVENKAGAGGLIGSDAVAKSKPDGYTILMAANTAAIVDATASKPPFSLERDLTGVAMIASMPMLLVVNRDLGVDTTAQLIQLAKAQPGALNFASSGPGTVQHMAGALFSAAADVKMEHVPFKGASQMMPELLANRVQVLIGPANSVLPYVKSGQLKPLGVTSRERWKAMPEVPTLAESGVPGYQIDLWYAVLAPSKTPPEIIGKLNQSINAYLRDPATRTRYEAQALTPWISTPEEVNALIQRDVARWKAAAAQIDLKLD